MDDLVADLPLVVAFTFLYLGWYISAGVFFIIFLFRLFTNY